MKLLTARDLPLESGCVFAVGVFDGVHPGHIRLLDKAKELSLSARLPLAVYTFGSMPHKGGYLTDAEEKLRLLSEYGADAVFCADFGSVRGVTARDFAENTVKKLFRAQYAVCGADLRFGAGREGTAELLAEYVPHVVTVPELRTDGKTVSSSLIRALVSEGNIKEASRFLGREYSFCFEVVRGTRLGSEIGFPTANQRFPKGACVPKTGVYSGRCELENVSYPCVTDIGVKPTVSESGEVVCETHIIGFSGELYGRKLRVYPHEYLRRELKFDTVSALRAQIAADIAEAKAKTDTGKI